MPLEQQLEYLGGALDPLGPRPLLALAASVPDAAVLAWAARALADRGFLAREAERQWLAGFLLERPDTTIQKVLRGLLEPAPERGEEVAALLVSVLEVVPVARLFISSYGLWPSRA